MQLLLVYIKNIKITRVIVESNFFSTFVVIENHNKTT